MDTVWISMRMLTPGIKCIVSTMEQWEHIRGLMITIRTGTVLILTVSQTSVSSCLTIRITHTPTGIVTMIIHHTPVVQEDFTILIHVLIKVALTLARLIVTIRGTCVRLQAM